MYINCDNDDNCTYSNCDNGDNCTYSNCDNGDNCTLYSRGSEEGTQASGEERFQGQEEEEVEQTNNTN